MKYWLEWLFFWIYRYRIPKRWDSDIYIENDLRHKIRKDLYRAKKIESAFFEIIEPNLRNKSKIIGCIYKHPNVPVAEFTSDFINPLLNI